MGAKTWMLVFGDGDIAAELNQSPRLDREASVAVATAFFPDEALEPLPDGALDCTNPPDDQVFAARLGGLTVIAAVEFAIDYPSRLPTRFLQAAGTGTVILHAMHSVVDWFAFAVWKNGQLVRSLSAAPDGGVMEDIGERLAFEQPYWEGRHPVDDPEDLEAGEEPYPLPFHPLELGEAALRELLGYQLEGRVDPALLDATTIPMLRFQRRKKKKFLGLW